MGEIAIARQLALEINVYGGAALAMVYDLRASTVDVDAVVRTDGAAYREIVGQVAQEFGWPDDWANDAVKGFLSDTEDMRVVLEEPGIRVQAPSVEYLLAMKAMAMRVDASDPKDIADIEALILRSRRTSAEEVLEIVEKHYPRRLILPKTRFGLIEIFERLRARGSL